MIECPHCKKSELIGAIFCRDCGTQIVPVSQGASTYHRTVKPPIDPDEIADTYPVKINRSVKVSPPKKQETDFDQNISTASPLPTQAGKPTKTTSWLTLQVIQSGDLIPITDDDEVTLGRTGAGQPIVPDIDLTPYHGLEAGVSRLHASIRIKNKEVYIMDLGSANGTRLNGEKLPPSTPHKVANEAVITLGKLNLKILIKS